MEASQLPKRPSSSNSAFLLAHSTFLAHAQEKKRNGANVNLWRNGISPKTQSCLLLLHLQPELMKFQQRSNYKRNMPRNIRHKFQDPQQLQLRLLLSSLLEFSICLFLSKQNSCETPRPLLIRADFGSGHSMTTTNPASYCPYLFLENTHAFNTNAKPSLGNTILPEKGFENETL